MVRLRGRDDDETSLSCFHPRSTVLNYAPVHQPRLQAPAYFSCLSPFNCRVSSSLLAFSPSEFLLLTSTSFLPRFSGWVLCLSLFPYFSLSHWQTYLSLLSAVPTRPLPRVFSSFGPLRFSFAFTAVLSFPAYRARWLISPGVFPKDT